MKKLKVRIVHFAEDWYSIEYKEDKWWKCWNTLAFWFSQTVSSNTYCWSTRLYKIDKAEEMAKSFKTIEDINNYYKPEEIKREEFLKKREEYFKKATPYSSKEF